MVVGQNGVPGPLAQRVAKAERQPGLVLAQTLLRLQDVRRKDLNVSTIQKGLMERRF